MNSKQVMNHAADNIRILAASMVEKPNPAIRAVQWVVPISSMYCTLNFAVRPG